MSPYVALWTRLADFHREDLAALLEDHTVVKATAIRATLHLITAEDYLRFRATLQPMLTAASATIAKRREEKRVRQYRTGGAWRGSIWPKNRAPSRRSARCSPGACRILTSAALRYTVRTHLPMVQVPIRTGWSYPGNPEFALAESWLGKPIAAGEELRALVYRYLAAFGPATVQDVQTWSGFAKLKDTIGEFKAELRIYRDERGRELLDLPEMTLPAAECTGAGAFSAGVR